MVPENLHLHEVSAKLLAAGCLQGVPDDLRVAAPGSPACGQSFCHEAGLFGGNMCGSALEDEMSVDPTTRFDAFELVLQSCLRRFLFARGSQRPSNVAGPSFTRQRHFLVLLCRSLHGGHSHCRLGKWCAGPRTACPNLE